MNPVPGKDIFTKILATVGTAVVWFPVLATVLTSVVGSVMSGVFRCDYLMPAELFPAALLGGGLLLWAALRARAWRGLIAWSYGVMVGLLVGGQAFAVANGSLSDGPAAEPAAWIVAVIIGSVAVYSLALLVVCVAGALLVHDLFYSSKGGSVPPVPAV